MRVVAIVQARLGSTRLPRKVLADLAGDTMLARVVQRLRSARSLHDIVVATTTHHDDDAVVRETGRLGAGVFRGPEHDVLARYVGAARTWRADAVVRITSDCPLIDPDVVDAVVRALLAGGYDYASNTHVRTYPRGLDVEALHVDTLARIDRLAHTPPTREHVTSLLMEQPEQFSLAQVTSATDDSDLRWTVDTADDLALVRALYEQLDLAHASVPYRTIVELVRANPLLATRNAHVEQKSWRSSHVA